MKSLSLFLLTILAAAHLFGQPVITNFTPASGPVGTTVTINGSGFSPTAANDLVTFGGIKASVLGATANTLTVTVPGGANYKPLSVATGGLTTTSTAAFDVTFPGGGSLAPTSFVQGGSTGTGSQFSALADFNGDGKIDMVCAGSVFSGLTIAINTTAGHKISFAQPITYTPPATNHQGVATGDLDGDGKPDIILSNDFYPVFSISIYRNTTSGGTVSFAANQDLTVNNFPGEIAVGDLDGDGKPDLAVADGSGGVISLYRNTSTPGNISFAPRVDLNPGFPPQSIFVDDLDGDGKADLILSIYTGLGVIKNRSTPGNFSFGSYIPCATGTRIVSVKAGDLDGDGKPDLFAADMGGNSIFLVKNNSSAGTLTFGPAQTIACFNNTNHVDIGDMDGDGKPDLVSSNINYPNVSVYRNTGSGAIAFAAATDYMIGNNSISFSAVADFDANGRPDIIGDSYIYINEVGAAPATISSFTPLYGLTGTPVTITGTNFTTATSVSFGGAPAQSFTINSPTQITAIVGGGASGLVMVDNADATATSLAGFYFSPPIVRDFYPTYGEKGTAVTIFGSNFTNITGVKFGNTPAASFTVDSLGGITAIVGDGGSGIITVTSPNGTSSLPEFSYNIPSITSFSPASGQVGSIVTITGKNFYPDTTFDIVRFGAVKARILSATTTELKVRVPAGASYQPLTVSTGSLTASALKPFGITFPSDANTITTHSFTPAGTMTARTNPADVTVVDFDGNGKPDIVALDRMAGYFSIFLNHGAIGKMTFAQRIDIYADTDPIHMLVTDMNGDGRPDVIVLNDGPLMGNVSPSQVKVYPNLSSPDYITFSDQTTLITSTGTQGVCIADINGDDLPDLIVSNGSTGIITIYPNTTYFGGGSGVVTFGTRIDITAIGHPDYIKAVDIDQDGRPDLVAADAAGNTLTVYRNTSTGGKFSLAPGVSQSTASSPTCITAGDLDGDGLPDLITGLNATSAAISDLNGDGKPDLGFGRSATGLISLWQNNYPGSGTLSFTPTIDLAAGQGDTWYYSSDLDGDSKPDLIVTNPGQNSISILRNNIGDPVITGITPDTAYKGTLVRLSGRNLAGGTAVSFGGVPADSVRNVSSTGLDAFVGGGASGNAVVTTLFGIDSIGGFVFIPQIIPEGDTVFCRGNYVMLRSTAITNDTWFKDGVQLGQDTVLRADSAGSYTVRTTSAGITTVSPVQKIIIKSVPTPVITEDAGNNLVSSALMGNQWYYNSWQPLDTIHIIHPGPAGTYSVTATQDGCTSEFAIYYWGGAQAIQLPDDQYIRYYPNPVTNDLYIDQHANGQPVPLDLTFTDARGHTLLTVRQTPGAIIDVASLPVGILFLHIHADGAFKVNKTVKILKVKKL